MGTKSRVLSLVTLCAVNCLLLVGGILILNFAIGVRRSGWFDVLDDYWMNASSTIITLLHVLGGFVIALGGIGMLCLSFRWRCGLLLLSIILFIFMLIMAVVAGAGFIVAKKADDWESKGYPVNQNEVNVRDNFENAYCYAQGAFICNELPLSDAAGLFLSSEVETTVVTLVGKQSTLGDACTQVKQLPMLATVQGVSETCKGCDLAAQYKKYSDILDWSNKKCPRSKDTLIWCGQRLILGEKKPKSGRDPYDRCRKNVLEIMRSYGENIATAGTIGSVGALLSILAACYLRRANRKAAEADFEDERAYLQHESNMQDGTSRVAKPLNR